MGDNGEELSSDEEQIYEPEQQQQKVAADFKSLDEMVQYYLGQCSCPTMFTLRKVGDGKYQIGNSKALIYMRILRNHVMVRVGGGWDTLENYLNKHDPCRCNRHRVEKHMRSNCINVERRSTGHVINGRSTTASPAPSGTSTRSSSARSRSTSHEMSRTLPSSFTQRRARPLRDENSSPSPASSGRRSQTPSRQKARMTTVQSTPKSKPDAPPRTRRLTANEATYKSARSRESSSERILDDKTSTR